MAWECWRVLESVGVREGGQERRYVRRRLLLLFFKGGYGPSWPTDGVRRYGVYKRVVILWVGRGRWVAGQEGEGVVEGKVGQEDARGGGYRLYV